MKYYVVAGEASGDLHASNLLREINQLDNKAIIRGWGGDRMQAQGATIVKHYRDLAFMGFLEVVKNLRTILKNLVDCKKDILAFKPDALILVDYPGFNLRIARFAKENGIKVFYYISPQLWAWKESRVKTVQQYVDRMFVILPFEEEFYRKHKFKADFVGHPLLDEIALRKSTSKVNPVKKVIALLPGSRMQEISMMLPLMIETVKKFPDYDAVIAAAPSIPLNVYSEIAGDSKINIMQGSTYEILESAHAALVTSGTATLEAALFNVPEVVCYKGGYISYRIAKALIKVKYISLVNLVMDREVVKELIQNDLTVENMVAELKEILNGPKRDFLLKSFEELKQKLGGTGASAKTAKMIVDSIS